MLTPQDMAIAEARVSGKSLQEIATPANVHESTISRRLAKTEVREYIEHLHQDLIASSLGKAVGNRVIFLDVCMSTEETPSETL